MIGFVLGNGKSRLDFDLQKISQYGKTYGCNALYRDFIPDVLVSVDPGITTELTRADIPNKTRHYTRKPQHEKSTELTEFMHRGFSSGPIAGKIASMDGCSTVFLIGFDFSSADGEFNNVYAGTPNYKSLGSEPTTYVNWVSQFKRIFKDYPNCKYYRILPDHGFQPDSWNELNNIENITKETFYTMLNSI